MKTPGQVFTFAIFVLNFVLGWTELFLKRPDPALFFFAWAGVFLALTAYLQRWGPRD